MQAVQQAVHAAVWADGEGRQAGTDGCCWVAGLPAWLLRLPGCSIHQSIHPSSRPAIKLAKHPASPVVAPRQAHLPAAAPRCLCLCVLPLAADEAEAVTQDVMVAPAGGCLQGRAEHNRAEGGERVTGSRRGRAVG